jgi:hypothetical protein
MPIISKPYKTSLELFEDIITKNMLKKPKGSPIANANCFRIILFLKIGTLVFH